MSIGAIGAEILGGVESTPPWYTSLKHPMTLGVKSQILVGMRNDFKIRISTRLSSEILFCHVPTCKLSLAGSFSYFFFDLPTMSTFLPRYVQFCKDRKSS